jgi:hypothetical protein
VGGKRGIDESEGDRERRGRDESEEIGREE